MIPAGEDGPETTGNTGVKFSTHIEETEPGETGCCWKGKCTENITLNYSIGTTQKSTVSPLRVNRRLWGARRDMVTLAAFLLSSLSLIKVRQALVCTQKEIATWKHFTQMQKNEWSCCFLGGLCLCTFLTIKGKIKPGL